LNQFQGNLLITHVLEGELLETRRVVHKYGLEGLSIAQLYFVHQGLPL
jgi:hypothetical protein